MCGSLVIYRACGEGSAESPWGETRRGARLPHALCVQYVLYGPADNKHLPGIDMLTKSWHFFMAPSLDDLERRLDYYYIGFSVALAAEPGFLFRIS